MDNVRRLFYLNNPYFKQLPSEANALYHSIVNQALAEKFAEEKEQVKKLPLHRRMTIFLRA